jgi:hypothetical protein
VVDNILKLCSLSEFEAIASLCAEPKVVVRENEDATFAVLLQTAGRDYGLSSASDVTKLNVFPSLVDAIATAMLVARSQHIWFEAIDLSDV